MKISLANLKQRVLLWLIRKLDKGMLAIGKTRKSEIYATVIRAGGKVEEVGLVSSPDPAKKELVCQNNEKIKLMNERVRLEQLEKQSQ